MNNVSVAVKRNITHTHNSIHTHTYFINKSSIKITHKQSIIAIPINGYEAGQNNKTVLNAGHFYDLKIKQIKAKRSQEKRHIKNYSTSAVECIRIEMRAGDYTTENVSKTKYQRKRTISAVMMAHFFYLYVWLITFLVVQSLTRISILMHSVVHGGQTLRHQFQLNEKNIYIYKHRTQYTYSQLWTIVCTRKFLSLSLSIYIFRFFSLVSLQQCALREATFYPMYKYVYYIYI